MVRWARQIVILPIRGLHGAFNLFIEFDDLQPPDLQAGEKWGSTFSWEDLQWTDTQQIQPDCCKYLHSNRRIGCCKFPLSRLMKSNVFDCSRRNFNACAWKLDTAIVQLGSIMCNQERTKGPPKDYVAFVIPGPLLFPFVLVFRCLVISCHNVLFSFFASYGIRISLRSTVTMSYEFIW
jgi:hypothetical protein